MNRAGLAEFRKFAKKQAVEGDLSAVKSAEAAIVSMGRDAGIGSD